jgi:hypothetical protein
MEKKQGNSCGTRRGADRSEADNRSRAKREDVACAIHHRSTRKPLGLKNEVRPDQVIDLELNFFRAIVAGFRWLSLAAMGTGGFDWLFASTIMEEELLGMSAVSENRLLEKQQEHHP